MTFAISRFSSLVDLLPSYESISWLDLVTVLSEPRRSPCTHKTCSQATCPYRQGACWSPGRQRVRAGLGVQAGLFHQCVEELTLLVLNVDRAAENRVDEIRGKLVDLQYLCHSTHSDRPNSRCLRFVFPLSRAVSADAWPRFWRAARQSLVPIADLVHWDVSRIYSLPSCPHDASYFVQVHEGARLDVDAVMYPELGRERFDGLPRSLAESALEGITSAAKNASHAVLDQPPPIVTARRPTWELVIEYVAQMQQEGAHAYLVVEYDVFSLVLSDMRARDALGRAVYGTPLTSGNGRDHLIDAYQELLDGCVYLMNELVERHVPLTGQLTEEEVPDWAERSYQRGVRALCLLQIRSAIQLRALIKSRTELSMAAQQWRAGRDASAGGGTLEADGEDNKTPFGDLDTCRHPVVSLAKTPVGGEAP